MFRFVLCFIAAMLAIIPSQATPTLVFDSKTGEVIESRQAGEPWYPASLTKVMTAYVIFNRLERGELKLDQILTVSELAAKQPSSKIGLRPGNAISVDLALQALLVSSANDLAYVLAEGASGNVDHFVASMNAYARKLDMSSTHFTNPTGLFDPRHVSTARDLGILAAAVYKEFPQFSHYFSQEFVQIGRRLSNHNSLLRDMVGADGMKTGFICDSGFNLIGSASREGRRLIAVVLGEQNSAARTRSVKSLLEKAFMKPVTNTEETHITAIKNLGLSAIIPENMTPVVCKTKSWLADIGPNDVSSWAVSLGTYDTAQKAAMALRGQLLLPAGLESHGTAGVLALPEKGFGALLWGLNQEASETLCRRYNAGNDRCVLMAPDVFAPLALNAILAKAPPAVAKTTENKNLKPKHVVKVKSKSNRKSKSL